MKLLGQIMPKCKFYTGSTEKKFRSTTHSKWSEILAWIQQARDSLMLISAAVLFVYDWDNECL